jgi:pantoate--beta-alanine ligase
MKPQIVREIDAVRHAVRHARGGSRTIGLVPTMGALHAGHGSLMRIARAETDFVIVSIFVNPTQFGPHEDFHRYPRPFDQDVAFCAAENVDLIFHPEPAVIYPPGFRTYVEVKDWQDVLEGASRPGHFRGVATVVLKLFNLVQPDVAYFGQKDAQQALLIRRMVHDLDVPVQVRVCPIVREADGLALSSRNQYLDPTQRRQAIVLHQALQHAQELVAAGERDAAVIQQAAAARIAATPGAVLDYLVLVNADTLDTLDRLQDNVLIAVAARFGTTRLIDNLLLANVRDS